MIKKDTMNNFDKKTKAKNFVKNKFVDEQTGQDTPKKISFKSRFIQWLKELPLDQRYLAVKVYAPGLATEIKHRLIELDNQPIHTNNQLVKRQKDLNSINHVYSKKINLKLLKQIFQSIVLITDGQQFFDNIGFDFIYIENPQRLYELLISTLSQNQKQNYLTVQQYEINFTQLKIIIENLNKSQSKEQLAYRLINYLRNQIFLKFDKNKLINLQEEKNRKKQFSIYWKGLSEQYKKKILLLYKEDCKALMNYLVDQGIMLQYGELEKQYNQLLKLDKNDFCNKIFKCKLKRSLTYYTDYHELVYRTWKTQLMKKKKRSKNQYNRNNTTNPSNTNNNGPNNTNSNHNIYKNHIDQNNDNAKNQISKNTINSKSISNSNSIIFSQINKDHNEKNENKQLIKHFKKINKTQNQEKILDELSVKNISNKRNKRKNHRGKKSNSTQSKQTNATLNKFTDDAEKSDKIFDDPQLIKIQSKHEEDLSSNKTENIIEEQNTQSKISASTTSSNAKEKANYLEKIDFENQIMNKICLDIQEYCDLINQEANQFHQRRVIAYERIQFMLNIWQIPIKLFGSCASGITIKNSDIDIAVDNKILDYFINVPQNHRLKSALQQLQVIFLQQPWVTYLKLIKTAAIPLIKMKVNTSIPFIDIPGCQIHSFYLQTLNRFHVQSGQIHIDLTIQTKNKQLQSNHLGIISTQCINNWLNDIKTLHTMIILIKNYLTNTNLNSTYEGGLNTYSMICMIVAFIFDNQLENQINVGINLKKLLNFYGNQFDENLKGIDPGNKNEIYFDKFKLKMTKSVKQCEGEYKLLELNHSKSVLLCQADLQIKDPLNNGKNMTKNCYSFPKIKQIFKKIHNECFINYQKRLQQLFKKQWDNKFNQMKLQKFKQNEMESKIKQLMKKCKERIDNPFLTLFS